MLSAKSLAIHSAKGISTLFAETIYFKHMLSLFHLLCTSINTI